MENQLLSKLYASSQWLLNLKVRVIIIKNLSFNYNMTWSEMGAVTKSGRGTWDSGMGTWGCDIGDAGT